MQILGPSFHQFSIMSVSRGRAELRREIILAIVSTHARDRDSAENCIASSRRDVCKSPSCLFHRFSMQRPWKYLDYVYVLSVK